MMPMSEEERRAVRATARGRISSTHERASVSILSEYLEAVEQDNEGRKTRVWAIHSKRGGGLLGFVRWYGAWRQYVFYPQGDYGAVVLFNTECLRAIADFLWVALLDQRAFSASRPL